jgi:hypothetical protein
MNKVFLLIFSILLFSCSEQEKQKGVDVLTEAQMIDALVEVHLLESASKLNMLEGTDSLNLKDYYYALFASKAYSLEEFRASFTFYSQEPKTMESLMDSVLTRIQMME